MPERIPAELRNRSRKRSRSNRTHAITRWLHVYTSMVALFLVLFFG
ncbi:MAG: hypothetical protein R2706_17095 [Acidimicrobiales bacterium]